MRSAWRPAVALACILSVATLLACNAALTPPPTFTPTFTPTPTSPPTPTSTPTPPPTPTPTPLPASYGATYDGAESTGAGDGFVQVELSLIVTNEGEATGQDVAVRVAVDDGAFQDGGMINGLAGGETATLAIVRALAPGEHRITFSVGGAERSEFVSVHAADLALELKEYAVAGDGAMAFEARVTNAGGIAAEDVAFSAAWTAQPGGDGVSGSVERVAVIERVGPGASEATTLLLPIPTGAYDIELSAATASLEAVTDDNAVDAPIAVEYIDLVLATGVTRVTGYEQDGDGIVEVPLRITNEGAAPSGTVTIGVLCNDAPPVCASSATLGSIPVGGSANATLTLVLPQGETLVTAYAGAPDDGYRWGERNTAQTVIRVLEKLPVELALDATAEVLGYWSDGTAEVELTLSLSNDGYRPAAESYDIAVSCHADGSEPMSGCGGTAKSVGLLDGFGPSEHMLRVRAPMGANLRASLADGAAASAPIAVPERILGVDRDVWECFSDRPGWEATYDNNFLGGCGGWTSPTVRKWNQEGPVTVWADPSGNSLYIRVLEETLDRLAPLLNLDFEWVDAREQAQLKAYVGVPATRSADIGFKDYCQDAAGCGGPDYYVDGAVTEASMSVWLDTRTRGSDELRAEVEHVTLHEALHALTAIHHRPSPISVMSVHSALRLRDMTDSDEALLRLHAHPLVRPGMTMKEVEELIVFANDLRDPPTAVAEENSVRLAERAYAALLEADSARFRVRGGWGEQSGCRDATFNGRYAIGDLGYGFPAVVRLDSNSRGFIFRYSESVGWRYWRQRASEWRGTSISAISDVTNWRNGFTDPADMLINVIIYADPGSVEITQPSPGEATLKVTLTDVKSLQPSWASSVTLRIAITLNTRTYEVSQYEMRWQFDVGNRDACSSYDVRATEGEYGIEIPIPETIAAVRPLLP